eukprot:COSAG04_NODE_54_length_30630_cov_12.996233_19_plen_426_part_00
MFFAYAFWRESTDAELREQGVLQTADVPYSRTNVYRYSPGYILYVSYCGGLLLLLGMLVTVLFRADVLPPPNLKWTRASPWNANDIEAPDVQADEDAGATDARQAEELSQMGRVLSLIIGPFALMITIMSCMMVVMHLITQDSKGDEWPRLRSAAELDGTSAETACSSPIAYFVCAPTRSLVVLRFSLSHGLFVEQGTISGVSANILPQGYVFMFVGITVNAVIVLERLPRLVVIGGRRKGFGENAAQKLKEDGAFPNRSLNVQCFLIRFGLVLTVFTAVLPDFAQGFYHGSQSLTFLHLLGIGLGIALALIGIFWYNYQACWVYCNKYYYSSGTEFWRYPQFWMPHVMSVWTFWLTLSMVFGFVAANKHQTPYDSYCESCNHIHAAASLTSGRHRQHLLFALPREHHEPLAVSPSQLVQRARLQ